MEFGWFSFYMRLNELTVKVTDLAIGDVFGGTTFRPSLNRILWNTSFIIADTIILPLLYFYPSLMFYFIRYLYAYLPS